MLQYVKDIIARGGTESDAWELLSHATGLSRTELILSDPTQLNAEQRHKISENIQEYLANNRPVGYITGSIFFNNLIIACEPPILIPRQETEEWVAALIQELIPHTALKQKPLKILDLCTGSGCIGLALAHAIPTAHITLVDNNSAAINLSKKNIFRLGFSQRVIPVLSNLYSELGLQKFDIIVANPPYIPADTIVEPSVAQWEDPEALFAGPDGLAIITQIITHAPQFLTPPITHDIPRLVLECDITHAEIVKKLCEQAGFTGVYIRPDLAKKPRSVWGY